MGPTDTVLTWFLLLLATACPGAPAGTVETARVIAIVAGHYLVTSVKEQFQYLGSAFLKEWKLIGQSVSAVVKSMVGYT